MSEFTTETSINRIGTLHPLLIANATGVYNSCIKDNIPIHITWARRSNEVQEVIFKYGRTVPGTILTTNRPGYSAHNYGLALDFCFFYDNKMQTWEEVQHHDWWRWMWIKVIKKFEDEGWETGFRWEYNYEPGHVQNLLDKTIGQWQIDSYD